MTKNYKGTANKTAYSEKLKDPRWQKKRLSILERDDWTCQGCQDTESMLVVHHRFYEKGEPWEAGDYALVTLCQSCHDHEHDVYPHNAAELIKVIKSKGFLSDDAGTLGEAIYGMKVINAPEYMASLIKFALNDEGTLEMICERFHADTMDRIEAMKNKKTEGENVTTN